MWNCVFLLIQHNILLTSTQLWEEIIKYENTATTTASSAPTTGTKKQRENMTLDFFLLK